MATTTRKVGADAIEVQRPDNAERRSTSRTTKPSMTVIHGEPYRYPTDDWTTDQIEERQDRFKREREVAVIKSMASFDWYCGMDFGCGTGRNFAVLVKLMRRFWQRRILGVDHDEDRLKTAEREARRFSDEFVNIECVRASADDLHLHVGDYRFDFILCCQVLTHLSRSDFAKTLNVLHSMLDRDGILVVCVPFRCADVRSDFYHLVDTATSLSSGYLKRTLVSASDYDAAAVKPAVGILPVRAFHLPPLTANTTARDLPLSVKAPAAFGKHKGFSVVSSFVYSIHEYHEERPLIGDIAIKLRKRRA